MYTHFPRSRFLQPQRSESWCWTGPGGKTRIRTSNMFYLVNAMRFRTVQQTVVSDRFMSCHHIISLFPWQTSWADWRPENLAADKSRHCNKLVSAPRKESESCEAINGISIVALIITAACDSWIQTLGSSCSQTASQWASFSFVPHLWQIGGGAWLEISGWIFYSASLGHSVLK